MHSALIFAALSTLAIWLWLRPVDFISHCDFLIGKLPNGNLEPIQPFVSVQQPDYAAFVLACGGHAGLRQMWLNMTVYVRLVQLFYRNRRIPKAQAAHIWGMAVCETLFTVMSGFEFSIRRFVPWFPLVASIEAARFYRDIVYRVDTLCSVKGAPESISKLSDLL